MLCFDALRAHAADPQAYTVTLEPTGTAQWDNALQNSSLLVTLRDNAPVPPFGLITRATGDVGRLTTAINSFGYYQPHVAITVAGFDINDPKLLMVLDKVPAGIPVAVTIAITTGPLYRLGEISIEGTVPESAAETLKLPAGDPAMASEIVAAQARLLTALQEQGYAFADVHQPIAYPHDDTQRLDIVFEVVTGPKLNIGKITFKGLEGVHEDVARNAFTVHSDELYRPSTIEAARQALLRTGVFSGVTVRPADSGGSNGQVDLLVEVQERPVHAISVAGTYSTDLGVSLSGEWSHRNLFGNAEQLNLTAAGTGLWGDATEDIGYQLSAQFIKPLFLRRDQQLELGLSAVQQDLDAYNQRAETVSMFIRRKFSKLWSGAVGTTLTDDIVSQKNTTRIYQLAGFPVTANYDSTGLTNPLDDPTTGSRARFQMTPTLAFGAKASIFFILQVSGSAYFNLSGDGRSVLAVRGLAGSVLGASNLDLPPDQRFYAGGSATVRGFKYQSIGPLFPDGDPVGGAALDAAGVELRQRLFGDWGAAAFIDAGQASAEALPFTGTLRAGAGFGVRYYSPIGVVRADVAVPLKRSLGGDAFEVYIGLGQAF